MRVFEGVVIEVMVALQIKELAVRRSPVQDDVCVRMGPVLVDRDQVIELPAFLTEEAPLLAAARFGAIRDLISVDMTALSFMWQNHETETVVLRPVHIVGAVRNAAMSYLSRKWCPVPMGFDPLVQLVHQNDVVDAMELCLKPGVRGVFNIDGPSAIPVSVVLREVGKQAVPIPDFMLRAGLNRMWKMRLSRFPPPEVDHIQWPATVDGTRARTDLGYTPQIPLSTIFRLIRDGDPLTDRVI